jgi:hypothetical protein
MRMAGNMAINAKRIALFAKFRTYGQIKMEINENGNRFKTFILSDTPIKNKPWILQIVFSTNTGSPTQLMFY